MANRKALFFSFYRQKEQVSFPISEEAALLSRLLQISLLVLVVFVVILLALLVFLLAVFLLIVLVFHFHPSSLNIVFKAGKSMIGNFFFLFATLTRSALK